jgi:hypothetical protein
MAQVQPWENIPIEVTPTAGPNVAATLGLAEAIRMAVRRSGPGRRTSHRVSPRWGGSSAGPYFARRSVSVISAQDFRSAAGTTSPDPPGVRATVCSPASAQSRRCSRRLFVAATSARWDAGRVRFAGAPSWQIRVDPWPTELDLALWIRAVERIPVPADGLVPGRLDLDPLPAASEPGLDPAQGVDGWTHWWAQLLDVAPPDARIVPLASQADSRVSAAQFTWLLPWPDLHRVVSQRSREAARWDNERKRTGLRDLHPLLRGGDDGRVVRQLEEEMHRAAPPFECELLVLPVCDDEIREFATGRYLIPERVYYGAQWPTVLTGLLRPLFDRLPEAAGQDATATVSVVRSTIAARVDLLLAAGLVTPTGEAVSTGGRPDTDQRRGAAPG